MTFLIRDQWFISLEGRKGSKKMKTVLINPNTESISSKQLEDKILLNNTTVIIGSIVKGKFKPYKKLKIVFESDFSLFRNRILENLSEDEWYMFVDGDEIPSPELLANLDSLGKEEGIDGYWVRRRNYISPTRFLRYGLFYPDYQLRIFKNKKQYRYTGTVHEQLNIPHEKTRELPYELYHFPTNPKYQSFSNYSNFLQYIHLQAQDLAKQKKTRLQLRIAGCMIAVSLFVNGMIRGKGILDGWAGFRAHSLFAWSQLVAYWKASRIVEVSN